MSLPNILPPKSLPHDMSGDLLIDKIRHKYSWAKGTTRGTESSQAQYQKDLKNAFAEIDGLMAGFKYMDEMHPTEEGRGASPARQSPPERIRAPEPVSPFKSWQAQAQPEDGDAHLPDTTSNPGSERQPMAVQWAAIKSLREETDYHHQRFLTTPAITSNAILSQLCESYKDAKSVRKAGIIIFRDVLDGYRPTKLKDIFAFASLSYSVSQLLFKSNRIEQSEILAGLEAWRESLPDAKEREAFDVLARHLWPESNEHLHFQATQTSIRRGTHPDLLDGWGREANEPAATSKQDHEGRSMPNWDSRWFDQNLAGFDYGQAAHNFAESDISLCLDNAINITNHTHNTFEFSLLNSWSSGMDTYHHQSGDGSRGGPSSQLADAESWSLNGRLPFTQDTEQRESSDNRHAEDLKLRDTKVFLVVLAFLAEIQELLNILSGRGIVPRPDKLYKAEEEDQKRFYKTAQEIFFEPRCCDQQVPCRDFSALLAMARIFTKEAYLRTIPDVKHYLVTVAVAVFPPGKLFQQFVMWVMSDNTYAPIAQSPENHTPQRVTAAQHSPAASANNDRRLYSCQFVGCEFNCRTASGLNKHERTKHQQGQPIQCPECEYSSIRRDRVRNHFKTQHPMQAPPRELLWVKRRAKMS
ncbi:hypothetical protein HD806DRAFT_496045 [Xylariaceae sp. AK1471]|nr:hypothetical protein HD806DRAFT_496045 [Xylariaceae sp. AK1471]